MVKKGNLETLVQEDIESLKNLAKAQVMGAVGGFALGLCLDHYMIDPDITLMSIIKSISGMGDTLVGFYYTHIYSKLKNKEISKDAKKFSSLNMLGLCLGVVSDNLGILPSNSITREFAYDTSDNLTSIFGNGVRKFLTDKKEGLKKYIKNPYAIGTSLGIATIATLHYVIRNYGVEPDTYSGNALLTGALNINSYFAYAAIKIYGKIKS